MAVALVALVLAAAPAASTSWRLERGPSKVAFRVGHLVFLSVEGRFRRFAGSVVSPGPGFDGASIEAVIEAGSVSTGHRDRDRELLGDEFFATDRFPAIRFVSSAVERLDERRYRVSGELTIRGVTREVVLEAEELERRSTRRGQRARLRANTAVNRFDYGLAWNDTWTGRALLDETVEITIDAVLLAAPGGAAKPGAPR